MFDKQCLIVFPELNTRETVWSTNLCVSHGIRTNEEFKNVTYQEWDTQSELAQIAFLVLQCMNRQKFYDTYKK